MNIKKKEFVIVFVIPLIHSYLFYKHINKVFNI